MLDNEDIGKINPGTPVVICRAMEMFLTDLIKESYNISKKEKNVRITKENIEEAISKNERLSFLNLGKKE